MERVLASQKLLWKRVCAGAEPYGQELKIGGSKNVDWYHADQPIQGMKMYF